MSTPALKPIRITSLLFDSGQIEKSELRLNFNPKKRSEELLGRSPLQNASSDQAQRRQMAVALSESARPDLERLINQNDLMGVSYLERGMVCGRAVGRVLVRDSSGDLIEYGTGFKISDRLLITNNHVLDSRETAANSQIEFNYQLDLAGRPEESEIFALKPDEFFFTHQDLDFTVVAIEPISSRGAALSAFGALPLMALKDKVLEGEYVSCLEHPGAQYKQVALRENHVVKAMENFLWYVTDTAPGASGSPMFNDSWQVVALHHSGVPDKDSAGNILALDGQIWKPEMGEERIKWIANEGVRISSIVAELTKSCGQHPLIKDAIPDGRVIEITPSAKRPSSGRVPGLQAITATAVPAVAIQPTEISVPVNLKITIGEAAPAEAEKAKAAKPVGFDEKFLPTRIALPTLNRTQLMDVAKFQDSLTIPYTHFSVCLSKSHRLAYFVAWNVNGGQLKKLSRSNLKFKFDSRIAQDYQAGDEVYADNKLDRGHLARRADLVWGPAAEAKQANIDSFYFPNITPQHQAFNQAQRNGLWGELEDALFDEVSVDDLRVSLMAGPIFKQNDLEYRGIRVPASFWKVLVYKDEDDGKFKAKAFVLTQKDLLNDIEAFALDEFRLYQVAIRELETFTGFSFGALRDADTFTTKMETEAFAAGGKRAVREVTSRKNLFG